MTFKTGCKSVPVQRLPDITDTIRTQDVERERAQPCEAARLAADAAVILAEDAVADVMIAVLDPPVMPHGVRESGGVEANLAGVVGHLLARRPQAGAGVLQPSQT
jgi:hypothetical protein